MFAGTGTQLWKPNILLKPRFSLEPLDLLIVENRGSYKKSFYQKKNRLLLNINIKMRLRFILWFLSALRILYIFKIFQKMFIKMFFFRNNTNILTYNLVQRSKLERIGKN